MFTTYRRREHASTLERSWVIVPLLAAILLAPTIAHRIPYIFWDTAQYYNYGSELFSFANRALHPSVSRDEGDAAPDGATGADHQISPRDVDVGTNESAQAAAAGQSTGILFYGARSPFYSVMFYVLSQLGGIWLLPITQAILTAWLIWRVAYYSGGKRHFAAAVTLTSIITFASSAWYFIGSVMPDAYAPIALLSAGLLLAFSGRMGWPERLAVAGALCIAMLFHTTHLVTAIAAIVAGGASIYLFMPSSSGRRLPIGIAVCSVLAAITAQLTFDAAARAAIGMAPKRPPFLSARVLADGPGRLYTREQCSGQTRFLICKYRDRSYLTADDFLWSGDPRKGVYSTLSREERVQLIEQEPLFVASVAMTYPWEMFKATAWNILGQLLLISPSEAWIDPAQQFASPPFRDARLFEVAPFLNGCIAEPGSCVPGISEGVVIALTFSSAAIALLIIAYHLGYSIRALGQTSIAERRACVFAIVLLSGIVVNAAVCGAVSGPHGRYESRVIWLLIIAAGVLELSRPLLLNRVFPKSFSDTKVT